jgi:hypothetical protein
MMSSPALKFVSEAMLSAFVWLIAGSMQSMISRAVSSRCIYGVC